MWPPALKVIRFLNENLDKFHISKKPSGRMNTADASIVFRLQDEYCTPVDIVVLGKPCYLESMFLKFHSRTQFNL